MSVEGADECRDGLNEEEEGGVDCRKLEWWHGECFQGGSSTYSLADDVSVGYSLEVGSPDLYGFGAEISRSCDAFPNFSFRYLLCTLEARCCNGCCTNWVNLKRETSRSIMVPDQPLRISMLKTST